MQAAPEHQEESSIVRGIRGLLIAIVALALSAGAAFAALPQVAGMGLARSSQAQQQGDEPTASTEPSRSPDESAEPSTSPDPSESADPSESPDATPAAPASSPAGGQGSHGALVSQAAQGPTPSGWPNHGAYVSSVARGISQPGGPAPAGPSTHGKSAQHGRPSN